MSNETVHFEALGYEPFRMKPVHFAAGFFLSLTKAHYELEMLNKTAVIKHNTGLRGDYGHDNLHGLLCEQQVLDPSVSVDELKLLRVQLNGIVGNDDAIYGSFKPYKKPPGVAYSVVSSRYLYDKQPLDGFSGYFVHQVLAQTTQGKAVLDFARMRMEHHASTLEQLVAPLLDDEGERQPFGFDYEQTFGKLNAQRLGDIAADMAAQTQALEVLCQNLAEHASHATQLRGLTIGLCSWLFVYLHRRATAAHGLSQRAPLFLMDFLGGSNPRLRAASRLSFARQRGLVFESYKAFRARKVVEFLDTDFSPKRGGSADFSFLEDHYRDLAVRIGFAQPRAFQARRKHFELQPDIIIGRATDIEFDLVHIHVRDILHAVFPRRENQCWRFCIHGTSKHAIKFNVSKPINSGAHVIVCKLPAKFLKFSFQFRCVHYLFPMSKLKVIEHG